MRGDLDELEAEAEQLRVALEDANLQLEEQATLASRQQRESDQAESVIADLSRQLTEAEQRAAAAEATADALRTAHRERDAYQQAYETTAEELQVANEELQLVNQDLEAHRTTLEQRVDERTAELAASEARMRAIVEAAHDAIVVADGAGLIQSVNPAVETMFGYADDDLLGRNIGVLMTSRDRAQHVGYLGRDLTLREHDHIGSSRLVMAQRRNGTMFPAELTVVEAASDGDRFFVASLRDVSPDIEHAGRAVARQAKLADMHSLSAMGGMSRALSHELSQPLSAIRCYIAAGRQVLGAGRGDAEMRLSLALGDLEKAEHEVERVGEMIKSLRELFELGRAERAVEDANAIVRDAVALALIGGPRSVAVRSHLADSLPPVYVNRVQIEEVVVNLVRNAVEAIGERDDGLVTVATAANDRDGDRFVQVTVSDNGPGLAPAVADRLFFPFVSTKARGTGIGLLICRSIVEAYGGTIEAANAADGGAEVRFTLPVARDKDLQHGAGAATA